MTSYRSFCPPEQSALVPPPPENQQTLRLAAAEPALASYWPFHQREQSALVPPLPENQNPPRPAGATSAMASYRPFHSPEQSALVPPPSNQNPWQPAAPPPPSLVVGNQYSENWGPSFGNQGFSYNYNYSQTDTRSSYQLSGCESLSSQRPHFNLPPRNQFPLLPLQPPFRYQPPPPPLESSSYFPPPQSPQAAPAPPSYYSSQNCQFNQPLSWQSSQASPPPPPPPFLPLIPPPLQPSCPPLLPAAFPPASVIRDSGYPNQGPSLKQVYKPPLPSSCEMLGMLEMEKQISLSKERKYEKQMQDEKLKKHLRESQEQVLQKTRMLLSGAKGPWSVSGLRVAGRKSMPLLSGDTHKNRLKKPTTFRCKMKFRNELPDPSQNLKQLTIRRNRLDEICKYKVTSLEREWKPQLYLEPDLGLPLDLLDMSVYNPLKGERIPVDPEDEELLATSSSSDDDDDLITPIATYGLRRGRLTYEDVPWLVKTQYISPLNKDSTKQSVEKQAKGLQKTQCPDLLENFNRDRKIQDIVASFEACKSPPFHAINCQLKLDKVLPLIPYFDRYSEQFVVANFDSAPTSDSEIYGQLNTADRVELENRAIMKSYMASSSILDSDRPDTLSACMVPAVDELEKVMDDENKDMQYSLVREYLFNVQGDEVGNPTTYLLVFGEFEAKYLPLPTKLVLRKKRATKGKSHELEHFPVPKTVAVRRRSII